MSTDEPDKTEETEPTGEETEAAAAEAAGAGADAPEADVEETPAAEEAKPKPRRRRRKAAEPVAEEAPAEPVAEETPAEPVAEEAPADPDLAAAQEAEDEAEAEALGEEPEDFEAEEAEVEEAAAEAEATPARPARSAPSRRRARRDPSLPPPIVRAQAKYVRSSARKARLVCDHIRGKSVEEARAILALTPRAIAQDWSKLLESAVANAEHNHELVGEDLYVKAVHADEGPTIKRFRPRAMGRATRIRKRTSHLTIMLTPKD
jgi:ribosomal protein L22